MKASILRLFFLLCLVPSFFAQGLRPNLDGKQIVQRMADHYANAKTYQDTGVVQTVSASTDPVIEEINSFKTYFARPELFRFEWEERNRYSKGDWSIIWSDGNEVFSYSHLMGLEKEKDLELAIGGATGISRGAAHTVSILLIPEQSGFRLTEMDRISLIREEEFEGEHCFVVRGFHPFGFPIDMWISKKDFLLRKSREQNDDGTFDEEIRRNVRINKEVSNNVFQFTPPETTERLIGCFLS